MAARGNGAHHGAERPNQEARVRQTTVEAPPRVTRPEPPTEGRAMTVDITHVEPDQIEGWTRDVVFTFRERTFTGYFGWNTSDGYRPWFTAVDGGSVPDALDDVDFLADLDDLSLAARRLSDAGEGTS
jgi:hypothetical protein